MLTDYEAPKGLQLRAPLLVFYLTDGHNFKPHDENGTAGTGRRVSDLQHMKESVMPDAHSIAIPYYYCCVD